MPLPTPVNTGADGMMSPGDVAIVAATQTAGPSFNTSSVNFPNWRRAVAKVLSGTSSANLLCMGDSTTEGDFMSNFGGTYPSVLTSLINQHIAPAAQTWTFFHSSATGLDTRVTFGANWVKGSGTGLQNSYWSNASGSDTWSYQPSLSGNGPATVDTFTVYYAQAAGHGAFTINVNGGATLATVDTAVGGTAIGSATVTFTATAAPTINIVGPTNGLGIFILAANSYLSTSNIIRVGNCGIGGAQAATWADTSVDYYPSNMFAKAAPDLSVIDLGINDAASLSVSQYSTNMQTIITNAKNAGGDVLLKSMVPSAVGTGLLPKEQAFAQALYPLAASNNCGLLDGQARWVTYEYSNPLGYYANTEHPSTLGCSDIARSVFRILHQL